MLGLATEVRSIHEGPSAIRGPGIPAATGWKEEPGTGHSAATLRGVPGRILLDATLQILQRQWDLRITGLGAELTTNPGSRLLEQTPEVNTGVLSQFQPDLKEHLRGVHWKPHFYNIHPPRQSGLHWEPPHRSHTSRSWAEPSETHKHQTKAGTPRDWLQWGQLGMDLFHRRRLSLGAPQSSVKSTQAPLGTR